MKNQNLLLLIGLVAIIGLLVIFSRAPTPEVPGVNETPTPEKTGAQKGDLVTVNFVLKYENGSVADTNDAELAQEHNLKNYVKGPYTFILGQSGKLATFDQAIIGMDVGEHKDTTLKPTEQELYVNITRAQTRDRLYAMPKLQRIKITTFESTYGKQPIIGDVVSKQGTFTLKVINKTENTVLGEIVTKEGDTYTLPNTQWESHVAKISEEDILFMQDPQENQTIDTPFGPAIIETTKSTYIIKYQPKLGSIVKHSVPLGDSYSIPQDFIVVDIKPGYFTIKRHGRLTDKTLNLSVDLLENTPGVKEVKEQKLFKTDVVN